MINDKIYIGQTINSLEHRRKQHYREAKNRNRKSVYFHNALNKYGFENFIFEQIDTASTLDELDKKEQYWIKYYNSMNKMFGYNLDSGGHKGGVKSESTKKKIGESTKIKWENPLIAEKMRDGLKKGTETMKKNIKRYAFVCPICNQIYYYPKHIASKKKFCSLDCATKSGAWKTGVTNSSIIIHQKNIERKKYIKNDVVEWVLNNQDTVLNCPYNKIQTTLTDLTNMIYEKYNIKDLRSIFVCFNINNKKSLLDELKNIIYISKENVC